MCGGGSGHEPAHAGFVGKMAASCFLDQAYLLHFQAKAFSRVCYRISILYRLLEYFIARCCVR